MRTFAFVYSRTKNHDYRFLSGLSDAVCPSEVRNCFEKRILGLTKDQKGMESPQWVLVKDRGTVLWGVACMNEMLDAAFSKDRFSRSLRGFTGYVIPNYSGEPLTNDINAFKEIFRKVMAPIFDSFVQEQSTDVLVDVNDAASFIYSKPFDSKLNKDYRQCRVFSSTVDAESLVASCLSCPDDISIATNVAHVESVSTAQYIPLVNAVMRDAMQVEIADIPVKHLCSNCGKEVRDMYDGLCRECWDAQHPRCSRCGKEISQLSDGLCKECWDELHPRNDNKNSSGRVNTASLCCSRCGRRVSRLSSKGLCETCGKRRRNRLWLCVTLAISLAIAVIVAFRECAVVPQITDKVGEDKTLDTMYRQHQPQDEPDTYIYSKDREEEKLESINVANEINAFDNNRSTRLVR